MAASKLSQGYTCEFTDCVPDHLCCKKCTLVARKLSIISCCGESFCQSCIADTRKEGKPCPACGEKNFTMFEHIKSQKQIASLRVYCCMKERSCDWSETLEQLDTDLDPDQDNCQYVDTKCPLNCHMTIPKNKVEQHVAQHCAKRPYVCQHCNFKATYEEVVDTHLPECKYVALQCPNLCGVTFERDFKEDHMKMCRLEEVGCEFSGVGCDGRFRREDQEEHTRQNSHKHLTLTASLAMETKEQLQQKLLEQDKKHKEEEENLKQKIEEQEKKMEEQEGMIESQEKEHKEEWEMLTQIIEEQRKDMQKLKQMFVLQECKLDEEMQKLSNKEQKLRHDEQKRNKEHEAEKENNVRKFEEQGKKLEGYQKFHDNTNAIVHVLESDSKERARQTEAKLSAFSQSLGLSHTFMMKDFSTEKSRDWMSPAMYTHVCGYCIGVNGNGRLGESENLSRHVC